MIIFKDPINPFETEVMVCDIKSLITYCVRKTADNVRDKMRRRKKKSA